MASEYSDSARIERAGRVRVRGVNVSMVVAECILDARVEAGFVDGAILCVLVLGESVGFMGVPQQ